MKLADETFGQAWMIQGEIVEIGNLENENREPGIVLKTNTGMITIKGLSHDELRALKHLFYENCVLSIGKPGDQAAEIDEDAMGEGESI